MFKPANFKTKAYLAGQKTALKPSSGLFQKSLKVRFVAPAVSEKFAYNIGAEAELPISPNLVRALHRGMATPADEKSMNWVQENLKKQILQQRHQYASMVKNGQITLNQLPELFRLEIGKPYKSNSSSI